MEACADSSFVCKNELEHLLETLASASSPIDPQVLADLLSQAITVNDLERWIVFDQAVYARNRVALLPNAEVIVMCWRSGQMTPIHDHKGSACAVKVIKGIATEISYRESNSKALVPTTSTRSFEGEVLHSFDEDIHQMGNLEDSFSDLVTLHVYSPPLKGMTFFDQHQAFFADYGSLFKKVSERLLQPVSHIEIDRKS